MYNFTIPMARMALVTAAVGVSFPSVMAGDKAGLKIWKEEAEKVCSKRTICC